MINQYIGYIYSITNEINGKIYIGKTNDLVRRWKEHYYGKGNTAILNKAFQKYGIEHFIFGIIAQVPFDNIEEMNAVLSQLEMYYISLYKTFGNGYNATAGGDGICFYKHSDETKEKLRLLQKEKWKNPELRQRMATAALGYHHTDDAKKRITQALLHRDPMVYEKVADKLRGKVRNHEMIMKGAEKRRKPILQYDMQGNFIREFDGISLAGFGRGTNIIACCKGKLHSAEGYIWRYKESENYVKKIDVPRIRSTRKKPVIQYDTFGNIVAEYSSMTQAAKMMNSSSSEFCRLMQKNKKIRGYIFKYKEEKEVTHV